MLLAANGLTHTVQSGPLLVAAGVAALVGVVGFLSPCVLPLVPGYLSYVAGLSGEGNQPSQRRMASGAVLFVAGFTAILRHAGRAVRRAGRLRQRAPAAPRTDHGRGHDRARRRVPRRLRRSCSASSGSTGCRGPGWSAPRCSASPFGLAWTPCLTPTFSRRLLAGSLSQGTAGRGAFLMVFYCLGLGIPFILVALGFGWVSSRARLRAPAPPRGQRYRGGAAHRHRRAAGQRRVGPPDQPVAHHRRHRLGDRDMSSGTSALAPGRCGPTRCGPGDG